MSVRILIGDALTRLRELPADSVDCVVTSPPYWGLRDYGTGTWHGGDPDCAHRSPTMREGRNESRAKLAGSAATNMAQLILAANSACGKCGAVKVDHQLGLEPTYQEHVAAIVAVFEEVRRVLKSTGTLWMNYGDSYATSPNGRSAADVKELTDDDRTFRDKPFSTIQGALKAKDLCGIPWRVAFALQDAGWYLRQDIIWSKPNPMPESIKDRCTKAHEYLFLMAKSARYYYDADAIAEPCVRGDAGSEFDSGQTAIHQLGRASAKPRKIKMPDGWDTGAGGHGRFHRNGREKGETRELGGKGQETPVDVRSSAGARMGRGAGWRDDPTTISTTRNKRSVWEVPTQSFPEAHFATFPPALIEPCILAGCPEGGTVLDPFFGAGTTGLVADRLQRNCIGIELNPEYAEIARRRIANEAGMFADIAIADTHPKGEDVEQASSLMSGGGAEGNRTTGNFTNQVTA